MPAVECLIVRNKCVLLMHRIQETTRSSMLVQIGDDVQSGESAIECCLRRVRQVTGFQVAPSCAAVIMTVTPGKGTDYSLTFVAEGPAQEPAQRSAGILEWVALSELSERDDVSELDRQLIPRILSSSEPITVLVDVDMTRPPTRRVAEISTIDPARLSPLVFAVTS